MDFNDSGGHDDPDLRKLIVEVGEKLGEHCRDYTEGGTIFLKREEILGAINGGFEQLVLSRHSVRMFDMRPIDQETIKKAVAIAICTQSVCNRQCWRVHCYQEPTLCAELLNIQGGGGGFEEDAYIFSLVTHGTGALVNIALNLIMIPKYGGVGAALVTVLSYTTASYVSLFIHPKTRPVSIMMTYAIGSPVIYGLKCLKGSSK